MFILFDEFNDKIISRHYTREAAEAAERRLQRAVKRHNGPTAYIPTDIRDGSKQECRK